MQASRGRWGRPVERERDWPDGGRRMGARGWMDACASVINGEVGRK